MTREAPRPASSLTKTNAWEQLGLRYLQPLVNTLGVELVVAGKDPEQLPRLKVTEADDTPGRTAQSVTSTLMAKERLIAEPEDIHPLQKGVHLHPEGRTWGTTLTASVRTDGCLD